MDTYRKGPLPFEKKWTYAGLHLSLLQKMGQPAEALVVTRQLKEEPLLTPMHIAHVAKSEVRLLMELGQEEAAYACFQDYLAESTTPQGRRKLTGLCAGVFSGYEKFDWAISTWKTCRAACKPSTRDWIQTSYSLADCYQSAGHTRKASELFGATIATLEKQMRLDNELAMEWSSSMGVLMLRKAECDVELGDTVRATLLADSAEANLAVLKELQRQLDVSTMEQREMIEQTQAKLEQVREMLRQAGNASRLEDIHQP